MFGMDGDKNAEGDQQYSTYIEAGYGFKVSDVDVTTSIGVSPWTGMYHKEGKDGFALSTLSVKASKSIRFSESFHCRYLPRPSWLPTGTMYFWYLE